MMQLIDCETGEVLLTRVEVALTWWQRFRGLMFRRNFCDGYGLWLHRCASIHTMWMRVPIDIYFVTKDGTVKERRLRVAPWSIAIPKEKPHSVLEIPDGKTVLEVGTRVRMESPGE